MILTKPPKTKLAKPNQIYRNLKGEAIALNNLLADEKKLVSELQSKAKRAKEWPAFRNWWMSRVAEFYETKGLARSEILRTAGYRIGQDLASRLMVKQGLARAPDYRDELEAIIAQRFSTRREFCKATGLSEDMVSHVLSKRKHLAVDTLEESLRRIGYMLRITPSVQG